MTRLENSPSDTLPKLFLDNVRGFGDRVALREKDLGIWKRISWSQYYEHTMLFCLGLKELGLQREDNVAILGDNCPEWLYADLAIQCASAVTVGIYQTDTAPQVQYILEDSESRFIVVRDQEQTDKVLEIKTALPRLERIIVIDMKGLRRYKNPLIMGFSQVEALGKKAANKHPGLFEELVRITRAASVALLVYTSGTTGPPKGVMLTHANILAMTEAMFSEEPFYENDSLVSALPLCHVAERMFSLFFPMKSGHTINFAENIETLQEDLIEISPTAFLNVPRIWEKMHSNILIKMQDAFPLKRRIFNLTIPIGERIAYFRYAGRSIPLLWKLLYGMAYILMFRHLRKKLGLLRCRLFYGGAAPFSPDVMKFFHAIGIWIKETYGQTEMSGMISTHPDDGIKPGTVGKVFKEIQCKIAPDGEILLKGDSVFSGYYGKPEATSEVIQDGWLLTGDVGELDEEGYLTIKDRKKDIIITSGGKNITPSEIENKLKFSLYIKEAVVIGDRRKYLTALIQLELDNVSNWAQTNRILFTTYKSLAQNEAIYELIRGEVENVNKELAQVETIKKFTILDKELDHDDDELTATMKVRRSIIEKKFADLIERMYKN